MSTQSTQTTQSTNRSANLDVVPETYFDAIAGGWRCQLSDRVSGNALHTTRSRPTLEAAEREAFDWLRRSAGRPDSDE